MKLRSSLSVFTMAALLGAACGNDTSSHPDPCAAELSPCSGECVDLASSPGDCGACGTVCGPTEVCSLGICKAECDTGLSACEGACVATATHERHCGACSNACPSGHACVNSVCEAPDTGTGGVTGTGGAGGTGGSGGTEPDIPLDTNVNLGIDQTLHINHIGYASAAPKQAVVEATGALSSFQIVRAGDMKVVLAGKLTSFDGFSDWGGGPNYYEADFSELSGEGRYTLYVNGEFSEQFEIADQLLAKKTLSSVLEYFKASRANDAHVWAADTAVPFVGMPEVTHDVRGGWYDASGDISKYLSHLSYANFVNPQQIPLVAWALGWVHDEASGLLTSQGLLEAVEQEALWGADYLLRVLDPAGYFYINVFDTWSGKVEQREICAYETDLGTKTNEWQAAFREGGGMSIAALARISNWNVNGAFAASEYLAGAETAFAHLQTHNYTDDGVENIIDDYAALLAASELYAVTEKSEYLNAARSRATSLIGRLHETGYFIADGGDRPFWHASDAGLPVVALSRYLELESDAEKRSLVTQAIKTHLDYLVSVTNAVKNPYGYARQHFDSEGKLQSGFFIPHDNETGYWWQGENARLSSLAAASLIGGRKAYPNETGGLKLPKEVGAYALDQLNWVLGLNPYDISFLKGFGRNNPPGYCNDKPEHGALTGGIANGITGKNTNGSGIQWGAADGLECWENWRWTEQWLPHSAWFLIATTAMTL